MDKDKGTAMGRRVRGLLLKTRHRASYVAIATAILTVVLGASNAAAAAPKVTSTSVSHVTTTSARLEAEINPEEKNLLYHFEYGPVDCSAEPDPCTTKASLEGAKSSHVPELITATLEGLTPGATYHFRVLAENGKTAADKAVGADVSFTTYLEEAPIQPCANDAIRKERPSAFLPDCRAYEQASPLDKNGADVDGGYNQVQASTDGGAITFFAAAGLPGALGAQDFETYLARRGAGEWSTAGVYPPAGDGAAAHNAGWTPDLSQFFSNSADALEGPWTFKERSSATGSFTPISAGGETESFLVGASADGSIVYFQNKSQSGLLPQAAPGANNLYAWDRDTDTVKLAGVLPDSACGSPPCTPPGGSFAGPYEWFVHTDKGTLSRGGREYYLQDEHAISSDGSKAYFTVPGGQLYLRKDATGPAPSTVHVSASQKENGGGPGGTDVNGTRPAAFMAATTDGSAAFFTSPEKLTDDATTGPEATEPPAIARAEIGGGNKKLDFLPTHAQGLFVAGEHLYWADPVEGLIGRAKLNGAGDATNPEPHFIEGAENPQYVTVAGEYVYWTNAKGEREDEGSIGRAKLGSSGPEGVDQDFLATTLSHFEPIENRQITVFNPRGIAVDATHIYWGDVGSAGATRAASSALMRSSLEGESAEEYGEFENGEFKAQHFSPQGLAIAGSFIYFSSHITNTEFSGLWRQSLLDPRTPPDFVEQTGATEGIALDGSHLYWANRATDAIGQSNLELGAPDDEFISGAAHPRGLAVDATHVYWSANQEVPENPGNDLYRFDAGSGELSDLTVDTGDPNGAEVKGVLGASDDGSYLYYAANGVPDGTANSPNGHDESATPGDCQGFGTLDNLNFSGQCNLYLRHGTQTTFIARLDATSDAADWEPVGTHLDAPQNTARVSADGQVLLVRLQGQFYRYQAGDTAPTCISCSPSGTPPIGRPTLQSIAPELPAVRPPGTPAILTRNLSADGRRIFFETPDKLVAADVDGEEGCPLEGQASVLSCQDVYEWEANGTGTCVSTAQSGGCLYLLSSGTRSEPAFFADASASGDDAFIFTRDSLVPQDQDQIQDVYDARVGGGLAAQNVIPPDPCREEACKPGQSAAPAFEAPQSQHFRGPGNSGNPGPSSGCPKGRHKVRRHGKPRCVAKTRHKGKQSKRRAAGASGRTGR